MSECRGLAPLARRHALVSTEARLARPVDIPNWSAWGDLHSQGCSGLSRTGLLFPVNHTPVGDPGLAPGRLGDFKSPGSAIPAEASRREMACRAEARLVDCEARLRSKLRRGSLALPGPRAKAGGHEGNCTPKAARF